MQEDSAYIKKRTVQLYTLAHRNAAATADRMFAVLLALQWLAGIGLAVWNSPRLWAGSLQTLNFPLVIAAFVGAALEAPGFVLALKRPGAPPTRHLVALSQMLWSMLLVYLTDGRTESHFHTFMSLAFLVFYRDWRVLATAWGVLALAQCGVGSLWPQLLYGTSLHSRWRPAEYLGWFLFAEVFLGWLAVQLDGETRNAAQRQAEVEEAKASVERCVGERTVHLSQANRDLTRQVGERQRAETEARSAREALDLTVRERTNELAAANRALKRQIEEGRRTSEELEQTVSRYRFTMDSVPQIMWIARPDGHIEYFNRRFHEYTGIDEDDALGWGWRPMVHPDDQTRAFERWQQCLASGEVYEIEYRLRRGGDGTYHWHLGRAVPLRNSSKEIIQWFGTCTDIDDQKRSREATSRSEQRYRSLVAASTQLVWLTDADGRISADVPEWRAATGQGYDEIRGYGWLNAVHGDDRDRAAELWHHAIKTRSPYEFEHRLLLKDGHSRHVASRAVPVIESDGRVREWIGTCTDITDRREAEEVLRRAQEELEARVRERTVQLTETNQILHQQVVERKQIEAELAEARDDALRSAKLKSEFLANMSHEIRTPMNGVIGMTSLLLDTPLNEEQHEYVETIRTSSDSLLTIINDILDFSKIEAGKLEFEEVEFDLQSTVEGAVDLLAEKAQAKGLDLACHVLEDVPRQLRGDPGRLRQVLVNLVGNAVKFTMTGRVLIHVAKLAESVGDTQLCFQVSDTGIGLSEEAAKGLFQPFVQADGSMTRKFGGTGLGLAISRQLVELMDGKIGVESAPEQGSTFWFTARLAKQPVVLADEDAPPEATIHFAGSRTLIVGTAGTGEVLRDQLGSWGMEATVLTEAMEALQAMRGAAGAGKPYNFVIVDAALPDMDGGTFARSIKTDGKIAAAKVVMLLAPGQRPVMASGEGEAAKAIDAYLNKPVKRQQLREYFQAALDPARGAATARRVIPAAPEPVATAPMRPSRRGRTHILIAEDNTVNQKVIIRQLEKIGYKADAVANGIETLAASAKVAYDLILMDCQMPEMDGFTATREIRQRERVHGIRTPIVALTANALEGDRDRCLAAGMDDYLSKPVKIDALQAMLEKWAAKAPEPAQAAA